MITDTQKIKLIKQIAETNDQVLISQLVQVINETTQNASMLSEMTSPIKRQLDLEEIKQEQNFKPVNKDEWNRLVQEADIRESIEELVDTSSQSISETLTNALIVFDELMQVNLSEPSRKFWTEYLRNLGRDDKWEELIKKANLLALYSSDWYFPYKMLGIAYYKKWQFEDAVICFSKAIERKFDDYYLYCYRAQSYLGVDEYDGDEHERAYADISKAIEIGGPSLAALYCYRSTLWQGLRGSEIDSINNAIKDFTSAIEYDRGEGPYHIERGKLWRKLGNYQKAANDFATAISKEIDSLNPYWDYEWEKNHPLDPEDHYPYGGPRADYERKLRDVEEEINSSPNNIDLHLKRALLHANYGYNKEAIYELDRYIENDLSDALGYYYRANVLSKNPEEYNRAIADYTESLKLDTGCAKSYLERGIVNYNLQKYAEAIDDFSTFLSIRPSEKSIQVFGHWQKEPLLNSEPLWLRGKAYLAVNRYEEAYDDLCTLAKKCNLYDPYYQYDPIYHTDLEVSNFKYVTDI